MRVALSGAMVMAVGLAWMTPVTGQSRTSGTTTGAPPAKVAPAKANTNDRPYVVPRTPWGDPDIQGIWDNGTPTPLERPADLADKEFLSDEEWKARANAEANRAAVRLDNAAADIELAYDNEWWDRGAPLKRTSLIIDPPNGKLPPLTAAGQALIAQRAAAAKARGVESYKDAKGVERRFAGWSMGQVNMQRLNPALLLKYSETGRLDPYAMSGTAMAALFTEMCASGAIAVS